VGSEAGGEPPSSQVAMSTTSRVMRGALLLLSTQPITWASSLLLTIFIPRLLDSRSLGEYTVAATLAGLVGALVSLGIPTVLTRRIAAQPASAAADVTASLLLLVGLGVLASVVAVALVQVIEPFDVSTLLLVLVFLGMIVSGVHGVLNSALTGFQRMGRYAWGNALLVASSAVLSIALIALGGGTIGLAVAGLVPLAVMAVISWRWLGVGINRSGMRPDALVKLAALGLPFLAWNILVRLRSDGDALVLGAMLSIEAVGWWAVALRVVSIPIFVPTLIIMPLLPALSQIVDDLAAFTMTLRRTFELTLIVTVGVSAAILAFAPVVPSILGWSAEYQPAVPVMQVLIFFFPLLSIGMVFGTGLIALGDERRLLAANVGATIVQYGLFLVAVPIARAWFDNGVLGVAISRVISELVMLAAAQILLPRGIITWRVWLFAVRVLLAGGALVAASLPLIDLAWPLAAVVGGLAYVLALFLVRAVRPSDVVTIAAWMKARGGRSSGVHGER
jgi:O-antigen/teichoic acid export membrane protein